MRALAEASQKLKSLPAGTLVLEGHCAGRPDENDEIRESVGEEAADLCKAQLQDAGLQNEMVCLGLGSAHGLGMCVRISLVDELDTVAGRTPAETRQHPFDVGASVQVRDRAPQDLARLPVEVEGDPQVAQSLGIVSKLSREELQERIDSVEESAVEQNDGAAAKFSLAQKLRGKLTANAPPPADSKKLNPMWGGIFNEVIRTEAQREAVPVDVEDWQIPETSGFSHDEQLPLLEEVLVERLPSGIAYDSNKSEIQNSSKHSVKQLARLLKAFPDLGIQCAGHAKGKPGDNNLMKRALSQERARTLKESLRAEGVTNSITCVGFGSALGRGNCVRLHPLLPGEADTEDAELKVLGCNTGNLSVEQEKASLDQLLKEALESGLAFEPNRASIQPQAKGVVRRIAWVLKAFPTWAILCEGHAKGQPADDNEAKRKLSLVRAEALRASLEDEGVTNKVVCMGHGCSHGLGMCVRMFALEPDRDIDVPDMDGLSLEERMQTLNELLARALERGIEFEPNRQEIPPSALGVIRTVARVLKAFPDCAVRCESHAKGRPADDNEAKRRLSQARAEAVRVALWTEGVSNGIICTGEGSKQGLGMCVKMFAVDPEKLHSRGIDIPDASNLSAKEQEDLANQLLKKALDKNIDFEPNSHAMPLSALETVQNVARVLEAFPAFSIRCEGHAKGQPADNNSAKMKLSYLRAEAVKAALKDKGVANNIHCVGRGSEEGLGMCVRMFVTDSATAHRKLVEIPDKEGLSTEEQATLLNELLARVLFRGITFEPNSSQIQVADMDTIYELARILKAFPGFVMRCEGHTKGQPADNNTAKTRLSERRAESIRAALQKEDVPNEIHCVGHGCSQGLGMCVRIFTN